MTRSPSTLRGGLPLGPNTATFYPILRRMSKSPSFSLFSFALLSMKSSGGRGSVCVGTRATHGDRAAMGANQKWRESWSADLLLIFHLTAVGGIGVFLLDFDQALTTSFSAPERNGVPHPSRCGRGAGEVWASRTEEKVSGSSFEHNQ